MRLSPLGHVVHHLLLDWTGIVDPVRMEQRCQAVVCDSSWVSRGVVPSSYDVIHDVAIHDDGQIAGWFVQDEREVVLAQLTVSRVRSVGIVEDFVLIDS